MHRSILVLILISMLCFAGSAYFAHTGLTGSFSLGLSQGAAIVCSEGYEPRSPLMNCRQAAESFNAGLSDFAKNDTQRRVLLFLALAGLTFLALATALVLTVVGFLRAKRSKPH